jgi:hypothetical protein
MQYVTQGAAVGTGRCKLMMVAELSVGSGLMSACDRNGKTLAEQSIHRRTVIPNHHLLPSNTVNSITTKPLPADILLVLPLLQIAAHRRPVRVNEQPKQCKIREHRQGQANTATMHCATRSKWNTKIGAKSMHQHRPTQSDKAHPTMTSLLARQDSLPWLRCMQTQAGRNCQACTPRAAAVRLVTTDAHIYICSP